MVLPQVMEQGKVLLVDLVILILLMLSLLDFRLPLLMAVDMEVVEVLT